MLCAVLCCLVVPPILIRVINYFKWDFGFGGHQDDSSLLRLDVL